ncbi:MAG: hypothetical protein ACJ789_07455 [Thermomicrobiales bacterium]
MDLRLAEYLTDFELRERWRAAARMLVQVTPPVSRSGAPPPWRLDSGICASAPVRDSK